MFKIQCYFILFLIFFWQTFVFAEEHSIPTINAVRTEEEIIIDGLLNESIWQGEGYSDLIQKNPIEGAPPTEKTSVHIAYNDQGLYIGARCYHSGSDSIQGGLARRDKSVQSDWFWFWIDPDKNGHNGFGFAVNPDGSIIDRKLFQDIHYDNDWDGVWEAAAKKHENVWTVEMLIPYNQLRFDKKDEYVMGINFMRYILKNAEYDYFVMVPKKETGFVSKFGLLKGIKGIEPPSRFQIMPYTMAKAYDLSEDKDSPFYDDNKYMQNIGIDLKYGITGNLTLDLTMNPDFGQAEVDPAQINLSAFETYYSEKRTFFIEGSEIFSFGDNPAGGLWGCYWAEPDIFYSRRIGRNPKGEASHEGFEDRPEQTTILGAAKITGRIGDWSVGSVSAVTDREFARVDSSGIRFKEEIEPRSYYGVLRSSKEFSKGNQGLGFIMTGVTRDLRTQGLKQIYNRNAFVYGMDGWSFLDKAREWAFIGKFAHSYADGTKERILDLQQESGHYYQRPDFDYISLDSNRTSLSGSMARFGLLKTKGNVSFQSALGIISPGFDTNDLGFSWFTNVINMHVVGGYSWFQPTNWFRRSSINLMISRNYDFDGNKLFQQYYFTGHITFLNYWGIHSSLQITPDGLDLFDTRGGPAIAYHGYQYMNLGFYSDDRKKVRVYGSMSYRAVNDGAYSRDFDIDFVYNPSPSIKLTLSANLYKELDHQQWVDNIADSSAVSTYDTKYIFSDLDETIRSGTIRLDWGFTPRLSFQMYIQPYIAVGHYSHFKELMEGGTYHFKEYDYQESNPDFNYKSFKANMVLRWEYRPGSLIYLVWTQNRENDDRPGVYNLKDDIQSLRDEDSDNIFLVKLNYLFTVR
ncbi:carbohydrate binding family 9 domain-containing protein [candidate division KSB1 bacterium]|nr:carbohydrate binding family 9 domain-containing protein [candidate division KSB1 bacterium]